MRGNKMDGVLLLIMDAIQKARDGVGFDARDGAMCPFCGQKTKITHTLPWMDNYRMRYHRCDNLDCVLCRIGESIKSWQRHNARNDKDL